MPNPPKDMSFLTAPASIDGAFLSYIPKEHADMMKMIDGKADFDLQNPKLNYYGGRLELATQVHAYQNFPGNMDKFRYNLSTPYVTIPVMYKSLKGKSYIYKQDALVQLQWKAVTLEMCTPENSSISDFLAIYLRTKEGLLNGQCEMVPYDEKEFDAFGKKVKMELSTKKHEHKLTLKTVDEVFGMMKGLFPKNKHDPEFSMLRKHIESIHKKTPIQDHVKFFENIINWLSIILKEFDKFLKSHEAWFHSDECIILGPGCCEKRIPVVRLFVDGDVKYVAGLQLFKEMYWSRRNPELIGPPFMNKGGPMGTATFEELSAFLGSRVDEIEFVVTPIRRTKHKAVPMIAPTQDYCIPTCDFVLEMLREWISAKGIFQGASEDEGADIIANFVFILFTLKDEEHGNHLINDKSMEELKKEFVDRMKESNIDEPKEKKEIRPVGPTGFTLKDLEDELKYLDLVVPFPGILGQAQLIHHNLSEKASILTTQDMYEALELSQLICVLNKSGVFFLDFLHRHGACSRLGLKCSLCPGVEEMRKEIEKFRNENK